MYAQIDGKSLRPSEEVVGESRHEWRWNQEAEDLWIWAVLGTVPQWA